MYEGVNNLEAYITKNNLTEIISLKGNQDKAKKKGYQQSHFTLLPSKVKVGQKHNKVLGLYSVGTAVSCVPLC
jgi:hypothetical protein